MIARLRAARHRDNGAAAVEFAILVPLLLLIVFGIMAVGLVLFSLISATHAAREAVRQIAVNDSGVTSCADLETYLATKSGFTPTNVVVVSEADGEPGDRITLTFDVPTNEGAVGALAGISSIFPGGSVVFPDSLSVEADARVEVAGDVSTGGC
jgi:hypothetical protein